MCFVNTTKENKKFNLESKALNNGYDLIQQEKYEIKR